MYSRLLPYLFLLSVFALRWSEEISYDEFLTLTKDQKLKFDKFKKLVLDKMPHPYMKEDDYLLRFLREVQFDIPAAERLILDNVKWREENDMENILEEDWTTYDRDLYGYLEGCDRDGHPVIAILAGGFDIRSYIVSGKGVRLRRYMDKIFEEIVSYIRLGKKYNIRVAQVTLVMDFDGWNWVEHMCAGCIPHYLHLVSSLWTHYPGYFHKIFAINVPDYAVPIFNIFRPTLPLTLWNLLELYGKNKDQWSERLQKEIDPSQLSKKYGGTKEEGWDSSALRKGAKELIGEFDKVWKDLNVTNFCTLVERYLIE